MVSTALSRACADDVLDVVPAAMDVVRSGMRAKLRSGLSVPQFRCLNHIDRHPGCALGDVAGMLGVTLPTASAMVDRLARAGHVCAAAAASDRRRAHLSISGSGKALLDQVRADARADLAEQLALQSTDTLRAIRAGLSALRRALP